MFLLVLDILRIFQYIAEYHAGHWVVAGSKYTAEILLLLDISLDIVFFLILNMLLIFQHIAVYPDVHWVVADY